MTILGIIIKDITILLKNCKYSTTIANRLVWLIGSYDLSVIDQFL